MVVRFDLGRDALRPFRMLAVAIMVSGCGSDRYAADQTVAISGEQRLSPIFSKDRSDHRKYGFPYWTTGIALWDSGRVFEFTDKTPRALVLGHIEVYRNGVHSDQTGFFAFDARRFKDNLITSGLAFEAIAFASGNWFAGRIFIGQRKLVHVSFPGRTFNGCGPIKWPSGIERRLEVAGEIALTDPSKAFYLGHIVVHREDFDTDDPFPTDKQRIRIEVTDRSAENSEWLRNATGGLPVEVALLPDCRLPIK